MAQLKYEELKTCLKKGGNVIGTLKLCFEAFSKNDEILRKAKGQLSFWCPQLFSLTFSSCASTRILAVKCLNLFMPIFVDRSEVLTDDWWKQLKQDITKKYAVLLAEQLNSFEDWNILWQMCVSILDLELYQSTTLVNALLKVAEKAFRDKKLVITAYKCWKHFIIVYAKSPNVMFSSKQIALLITPLIAKSHFTLALCTIKLEVWRTLIELVVDKSKQAVDVIVAPFLSFLYGPLKMPISSSFPELVDESADSYLLVLNNPNVFKYIHTSIASYLPKVILSLISSKKVNENLVIQVWDTFFAKVSQVQVMSLLDNAVECLNDFSLKLNEENVHLFLKLLEIFVRKQPNTAVKHLSGWIFCHNFLALKSSVEGPCLKNTLKFFGKNVSQLEPVIHTMFAVAVSLERDDLKKGSTCLSNFNELWLILTDIIHQVAESKNDLTSCSLSMQTLLQLLLFPVEYLHEKWCSRIAKQWRMLCNDVDLFLTPSENFTEFGPKLIDNLLMVMEKHPKSLASVVYAALEICGILLSSTMLKGNVKQAMPLLTSIVRLLNDIESVPIRQEILLNEALPKISLWSNLHFEINTDLLSLMDAIIPMIGTGSDGTSVKLKNKIAKIIRIIRNNAVQTGSKQTNRDVPSTPKSAIRNTSFMQRLDRASRTKQQNTNDQLKKLLLNQEKKEDDEFVVIQPKTKVTPLTKHQKEVMKTRRTIPAMYCGLSQDTQSQDSQALDVIVSVAGERPVRKTLDFSNENAIDELIDECEAKCAPFSIDETLSMLSKSKIDSSVAEKKEGSEEERTENLKPSSIVSSSNVAESSKDVVTVSKNKKVETIEKVIDSGTKALDILQEKEDNVVSETAEPPEKKCKIEMCSKLLSLLKDYCNSSGSDFGKLFNILINEPHPALYLFHKLKELLNKSNDQYEEVQKICKEFSLENLTDLFEILDKTITDDSTSSESEDISEEDIRIVQSSVEKKDDDVKKGDLVAIEDFRSDMKTTADSQNDSKKSSKTDVQSSISKINPIEDQFTSDNRDKNFEPIAPSRIRRKITPPKKYSPSKRYAPSKVSPKLLRSRKSLTLPASKPAASFKQRRSLNVKSKTPILPKNKVARNGDVISVNGDVVKEDVVEETIEKLPIAEKASGEKIILTSDGPLQPASNVKSATVSDDTLAVNGDVVVEDVNKEATEKEIFVENDGQNQKEKSSEENRPNIVENDNPLEENIVSTTIDSSILIDGSMKKDLESCVKEEEVDLTHDENFEEVFEIENRKPFEDENLIVLDEKSDKMEVDDDILKLDESNEILDKSDRKDQDRKCLEGNKSNIEACAVGEKESQCTNEALVRSESLKASCASKNTVSVPENSPEIFDSVDVNISEQTGLLTENPSAIAAGESDGEKDEKSSNSENSNRSKSKVKKTNSIVKNKKGKHLKDLVCNGSPLKVDSINSCTKEKVFSNLDSWIMRSNKPIDHTAKSVEFSQNSDIVESSQPEVSLSSFKVNKNTSVSSPCLAQIISNSYSSPKSTIETEPNSGSKPKVARKLILNERGESFENDNCDKSKFAPVNNENSCNEAAKKSETEENVKSNLSINLKLNENAKVLSPRNQYLGRTTLMMNMAIGEDAKLMTPSSKTSKKESSVTPSPPRTPQNLNSVGKKWVKRRYVSDAPPTPSILKKGRCEENDFRSKVKLVSFSDPPMIEVLEFSASDPQRDTVYGLEIPALAENTQDDLNTQGSIPEIPEVSDTKRAYPSLSSCPDSIDVIIPLLVEPKWHSVLKEKFEVKNIFTVGSLASLTELQACQLPVGEPRLFRIKNALKDYHRSLQEKYREAEEQKRQERSKFMSKFLMPTGADRRSSKSSESSSKKSKNERTEKDLENVPPKEIKSSNEDVANTSSTQSILACKDLNTAMSKLIDKNIESSRKSSNLENKIKLVDVESTSEAEIVSSTSLDSPNKANTSVSKDKQNMLNFADPMQEVSESELRCQEINFTPDKLEKLNFKPNDSEPVSSSNSLFKSSKYEESPIKNSGPFVEKNFKEICETKSTDHETFIQEVSVPCKTNETSAADTHESLADVTKSKTNALNDSIASGEEKLCQYLHKTAVSHTPNENLESNLEIKDVSNDFSLDVEKRSNNLNNQEIVSILDEYESDKIKEASAMSEVGNSKSEKEVMSVKNLSLTSNIPLNFNEENEAAKSLEINNLGTEKISSSIRVEDSNLLNKKGLIQSEESDQKVDSVCTTWLENTDISLASPSKEAPCDSINEGFNIDKMDLIESSQESLESTKVSTTEEAAPAVLSREKEVSSVTSDAEKEVKLAGESSNRTLRKRRASPNDDDVKSCKVPRSVEPISARKTTHFSRCRNVAPSLKENDETSPLKNPAEITDSHCTKTSKTIETESVILEGPSASQKEVAVTIENSSDDMSLSCCKELPVTLEKSIISDISSAEDENELNLSNEEAVTGKQLRKLESMKKSFECDSKLKKELVKMLFHDEDASACVALLKDSVLSRTDVKRYLFNHLLNDPLLGVKFCVKF